MSKSALPRRAWLIGLSLASLLSATAACSALLGLEPPPTQTSGACTTRYVSANGGDDSASGCSTSAPMQTIKAALGAFGSEGAPGFTVKVCAGQYAETDLKMTLPGTLAGGFSCKDAKDWSRTQAYATDGINETVVTVKAPDSTHATVLTIGAPPASSGPPLVEGGATSGVMIDGLTVNGPSGLPTSTGIQWGSGASGVLTSCKVTAGDATDASIGVSVTGSAAPELVGNVITSGAAAGTAGISVNSTGAPPHIHGNRITAGQSSGAATAEFTAGSYGIFATGALAFGDATAIDGNVVQAGIGEPSEGIRVLGAGPVVITNNRVQAGASLATQTTAAKTGLRAISVESSSAVRILKNLVYGGGNHANAGPFTGITLYQVTSGVVANNMVYGGFRQATDTFPGTAYGISLLGCTSPVVVANTIFTGYGGSQNLASDVQVAGGTTSAILDNNVFAGGGVNDYGVITDSCGNAFGAIANNLFVGHNNGAARNACGPDGGSNVARDVATVAAALHAEGGVGGNVTMRSSDTCSKADLDAGMCLAQAACPFPMPGGSADQGCMQSLFGAWSSVDNGWATGFGDGGWPLLPTAPCVVTTGGLDLADAGAATDYYGVKRGSKPAMGAAEVAPGACTP